MISFANAAGNCFNILGALGGMVKNVRDYQSSQEATMIDSPSGATYQLAAMSDLQSLIGNSYLSQLATPETACTLAQQVAVQVVNRVVFNDQPQIAQSLTTLNTLASLTEIIRQMKAQGASVLAATITATPQLFTSYTTNIGNGVCVASIRRPSDGLVLENAFAEQVQFQCVDDSYSGDATAGNEQFTLNGTGSQSDFYAFNWPLGSNVSTSLNAIDSQANNDEGNELTNSSFDAWTANVPDNWTLVTGTAGTNITQESTIIFGGTSSAAITGDASGTLTSITQTFNLAAGTAGTLTTETQYGFNAWIRRDGTAPGTGVLSIELIDGNNNIINDAGGTPNSFTVDCTALTTSYVAYNAMFRTPVVLPSTVKLRIRLTTALTDSRTIYIDSASFGQATQHYISGIFWSIHGGSTPFAIGDSIYAPVTNSRGSGGTLSTFQTLMSRLFPSEVFGNELLFPSSAAGNTISDNLIQ